MGWSDVASQPRVDTATGARVPRGSEFAFRNVLGRSPQIQRAIALGCRVAEHPGTTVLLHGETGTGKELFARGIHYASANGGDPFVAINCSAIPENLLESELFGHEKGAFTDAHTQKRGLLELAGRGTVFLDEIGELPPTLQPKLLRVLEEKRVRRLGGLEEQEIQCRVIAATNRDLSVSVAEGAFREDLYYRLNVFRIDLPPLRDRGRDIEEMAAHFVEAMCREQGIPPKTLSPDAIALLYAHDWRGNIRELKNAIERAIILSDGAVIAAEHILIQRRSNVPVSALTDEDDAVAATIQVPRSGLTLEDAERQLLAVTLRLANHNHTLAARMLGVSRPTVIRKVRKYRLHAPQT
ncbi:MAG TPA: sigma 54-interacting transcriptional regulator [Longimicrobiales bacterium]